jgi:hemerythrin-like domain-containing protein
MKTTAILKEEHKLITRALDVIELMAARRESGKPVDGRDIEDILRFLYLFADGHHQGKEEMILFPALLRDREQRNHAALSQLILAHNQERSIVAGLEESFRRDHAGDFVYFAKRLLQVLRAHIENEDIHLFSLVDATLRPMEDEAVARELEDFERRWKETVLTGLVSRLTEIERMLSPLHEARH